MKEFKEARERYEATPIPEELDRRVRAGIRQGRSRYRARRLRRSLGAAAACLVARSVGRVDRPSGPMPEATAPEDTRIRSLPLAMRFSSASAISSIFAGSVRPSGPVREDDPIFTTILFASRMLSRVELE